MGLDLAVSTVALIALFGFAYRKALLNSSVWKIWLVVYIIWDILYFIFLADWTFLADRPLSDLVIVSIIATAFIVPSYVAQYLYAFRRSGSGLDIRHSAVQRSPARHPLTQQPSSDTSTHTN